MKKILALPFILMCVFVIAACDNIYKTETPNGTSSGNTESETDAHVHEYGEWTIISPPTCSVKGEQERICSCGAKETQCIDTTAHTEVTEDEEQDLKGWISGQNSDGLGEGFEQREIYFEGGHRGAFMYVSLWSPDDDYFIDNQDEFEDRLMSDGMTMGGM